MSTAQMAQWANDFGRDYTHRNSLTREDLDALYRRNYGISRTQLNKFFLAEVPLDARILEIGCNVGNQLLLLRRMGYRNLYGIEIQHHALQQARAGLADVHLVEASAFEIPYANGYFDLVFTSGVLIHIAPGDLSRAVAEIHRCTRKYIWGLEYYSPQPREVEYRGRWGLLWKMDFAGLYLDRFKDLEVVRTSRLHYLENSNVDSMFLLRKKEPRE
jgi:pseudaminic acid biosynthesis-associated methylase